ncbi:MAG: polysaccharide biosynthesis tyrosine autokinase [Flavobacteriales bacterium]|nr:polysaccharide biosynthesis tyrosine autokinase [Flavobacteriales bacterium]
MLENSPTSKTIGEIDILDPKRILEKALSKWYIFISSILFSLLLSYYITKETTPIYESESLLLISEDKNTLNLDIFSTERGSSGNTSLQNEIVTLQTHSLAVKTVKKLDLNVTYLRESLWRLKPIYNTYPIRVEVNWDKPQLINTLFKLTPEGNNAFTLTPTEGEGSQLYTKSKNVGADSYADLPGGTLTEIKGKFGEVITTPFFEFTIIDFQASNFDEIYFRIQDDEKVAKSFNALVQVSPANKETTALKIRIEHPDKKIGELYINTLMDSFLESDLNERSLTSQQTLDFIQNQIATVSDSLNVYENELQSYRKINRITSLSEKGSNILSESVKLEDELGKQTLRLEYYQNLKKYLSNPEGQELLVPSVIGIEDPLFNTMVSDLLKLQNEKSGLRGVLAGDSFAYVRELNSKIENLKINLNESIANAIVNISTHISRLKGMLGVVEKDFNLLPEVERNLISIERRFKLNESIYTFLLQKKAETEIQKASTITKHRILDTAMLNNTPVSPKLSRNLAIGASLGIVVPLLILIIWSLFYHKVMDPKEVENLLKIPVLGFVPREKERTPILDQNSKSTLTESFRTIRSNLSIRFDFKDKGTILVTSTRPGEGKTFVSIKIASIYAALGKKTLLVGMDLRKPAIHKELDTLHNKSGVTTYLLQSENNWKNLLQATGQENLDLLNAGPFVERSAELINTKRFEKLMEELKESYDFVVIDTSPIGLVSETMDLTRYSDINLFILRQNYSFINQVQIANDLKEKMGLDNLYAIVNDMHKFGIDGYYYGYGYGYGYYSNYNTYTEEKKKGLMEKLFG